MIILELKAGYMFLTIPNDCLKQFGGAKVTEFIGGLKMAIPPYDRGYDPDTHIWTIKDRPEHRKCIEQLRDFYFTDKDQIGMFEEA